MTFDEYQQQAATTDILGNGKSKDVLASDPAYVAKILGLVGEAGEIAEKYKKIIRDKKGIINDQDKEELIKELGDVLWYTALLARYLSVPFEAVARANLDKLASRKNRNALHGKGDNR